MIRTRLLKLKTDDLLVISLLVFVTSLAPEFRFFGGWSENRTSKTHQKQKGSNQKKHRTTSVGKASWSNLAGRCSILNERMCLDEVLLILICYIQNLAQHGSSALWMTGKKKDLATPQRSLWSRVRLIGVATNVEFLVDGERNEIFGDLNPNTLACVEDIQPESSDVKEKDFAHLAFGGYIAEVCQRFVVAVAVVSLEVKNREAK